MNIIQAGWQSWRDIALYVLNVLWIAVKLYEIQSAFWFYDIFILFDSSFGFTMYSLDQIYLWVRDEILILPGMLGSW